MDNSRLKQILENNIAFQNFLRMHLCSGYLPRKRDEIRGRNFRCPSSICLVQRRFCGSMISSALFCRNFPLPRASSSPTSPCRKASAVFLSRGTAFALTVIETCEEDFGGHLFVHDSFP